MLAAEADWLQYFAPACPSLSRIGNFPLGLNQQFNHLLGPAIPYSLFTVLMEKHQLQQVMRVAWAVQAIQIFEAQQLSIDQRSAHI